MLMHTLTTVWLPALFLFAGPPEGPAGDRSEGRAAQLLARLDADGSGSLSASEVEGTKLEPRFVRIDADHDGEITGAELGAFRKAQQEKKARRRKRMKAHFAKLDVNADRKLSVAEVQGTRLEPRFAALDTDQSGDLTIAELRAGRAAHRKSRRDASGDCRCPPEAPTDDSSANRFDSTR